MKTEVATYQSVHLADRAEVRWGEPEELGTGSWKVELVVTCWPHGEHSVTYFGTEAQIRAIAGGPVDAVDAPDPAQLDALEAAKPEPLSERTDMVDLATRAVGLGVARW